MKSLILFFVALMAASCMYQPPMLISQPPAPSSTTVQSAPSTMLPSTGQQVEVWRPDPTAGIVGNQSRNLFLRLWINSRPPSPPTLELGPEQSAPVNVPLGSHTIYAEGRLRTPNYGWISVGTASRRFEIRNWSGTYGGFAWRQYFNDGDFGR